MIDKQTYYDWEFEAIEVIRGQFPRVGVNFPAMNGDVTNWLILYLVVCIIDRAAFQIEDRAEICITFRDSNIEYRIVSRDKHSHVDYAELIRLFCMGQRSTLDHLTGLHEYLPGYHVDHRKNISTLEDLSGQKSGVPESADQSSGRLHFPTPVEVSKGVFIGKVP